MQRILIVEDDIEIQDMLRNYLTDAGYEVVIAEDGVTGIAKFDDTINLVLLDIMLPKIDGYGVCEVIRQRSQVPIIMLTALSDEENQIKGFEQQIDDYIPKPFRMMELISRIKARLRRLEDKGAEEYRIGSLYVCPSRHVVTVNKEPVNLTLKEYEMLCLLLKNSGMVLSRTQLLNQIWGYEFDGESRTVDVHIRTLRQKLGDAGDLIETVRGIGYKMGK